MTRHARNCTAGAVYTYHEKKKDAQASGYGTNAKRLGKDSVKDFDSCSLSLQPCRYPVISKDGYLFDKEVIYQYIITKKNEYSRKLKEYERCKKKEEEDDIKKDLEKTENQVKLFVSKENNIVSKALDGFKSNEDKESLSISNMDVGRDKILPSFWVPSKTPSAEKSKMEKPDPIIYCPVSGKPLKAKDLIDVKFTLVKDNEKKSLIARENRYMCAVTHDILSNSVPCAVLKTTGDVVTMECVEKIIKKDWIHPLTNQKLKEKDIIVMERGGTGYSQTNDNLEGKQERPAIQA